MKRNAARSTWSRNDFHRKYTVRGESQLGPRLLELPRNEAAVLPGHGWMLPEPGMIKISCDGALNMAEGRGGAGGIARSISVLLGAWCKPFGDISDPLIMEALSMREGMLFAKL